MDNSVILDENATRVLDILEQIKSLNKMIELHKTQSQDNFMVSQYQDMKNRFLTELKILLEQYEIEVLIKGQAAA